MFAVIYRAFVYPHLDEEYRLHWKTIVEYFTTHCGAIGSTLHKTAAGEYIAYSRWPNRETRDRFWGDTATHAFDEDIQNVIVKLKACLDMSKPYDEIEMEVVEAL
ncbi:MAG: hypothetical protein K0R48_979 [Gammaproteobacteria bacterium]|jgi:hypothetical protein|nr:hypothetical protein [Gammaproteobacteria bacterium]